MIEGGFKSEAAGAFLNLQNKYSKSLSWAENLNFPPKQVVQIFYSGFSDLEYRTHAILSHGLYAFYTIFEDHFIVFKDFFSWKLCPYVRLVFKNGL